MGYECAIWAGKPGPVVTLQEAASNDAKFFQIGDLVRINADGEVSLGSDGHVHAIARSNATGTDGTEHQIELLNPSAVYSMQYDTSTTESLIGDQVKLDVVTTGLQELGADNTTAIALVVGLHPDDGIVTDDSSASQTRRVLVTFLDSVIKAAGAAA